MLRRTNSYRSTKGENGAGENESMVLLNAVHESTRKQVKDFVKNDLRPRDDKKLVKSHVVDILAAVWAVDKEGKWSVDTGHPDAVVLAEKIMDGKPTIILGSLLDKELCTEVGPLGKFTAFSEGEVFQPLKSIEIKPVKLLIPDDEASAVAGSKQQGSSRYRILGSFSDHVWKLRTNFFKNWKKQWLVADATGISFSKQAGTSTTTITYDKIVSLHPTRQEDVGSKVKLKPECFTIKTRDDKVVVFSCEGMKINAGKWCKIIASHALLHSLQHNHSPQQIQQLCDMGADVNVALADGRQYPTVALAMMNNSTGTNEVTKYLIRRGADPSCLLRWSFLMIDKVAEPVDILQLLIDTKKDLDVCSDDKHEWTLLHYLAYKGDLASVRKLIARVDIPTIHALNTLGDCSLMLALKEHGQTPSESIQKMCITLSKNCNVNRRDKWNDTLLHLAVKQGHIELAKLLVKQKARLDDRDCNGDTALHIAMKRSFYPLVRWMVGQVVENVDIDVRGILDLQDEAKGDTIFTLALKLGQEDLALFLLQHGASCAIPSREWELALGCRDDSPLQVAIKLGMRNLAKTMVSKYCACAELWQLDSEGVPPLVLAIRRSMLELALVMVQSTGRHAENAFLNVATRKDSMTALHVALEKGLLELASTLIDYGADVNVRNVLGHGALHQCLDLLNHVNNTKYQEARVLVFIEGLFTKKINPSVRSGACGLTPVHLGVTIGCLNAVHLLLKIGGPALADECDKGGNSALNLAILINRVDIVKLIIDQGANVNIVNRSNESPLHLAIMSKNEKILEMLLKHNSYPAVWDKDGYCPIHLISMNNEASMAKVFCTHCKVPGHLNLRTEEGHTAAMLAAMNGCLDTLQIFVSHKADLLLKLPNSRIGIFHIVADLCLSRKKPFWGSGVPEYLLTLDVESGWWDQAKNGTSITDAKRFIAKRLTMKGAAAPDSPPQSGKNNTMVMTGRGRYRASLGSSSSSQEDNNNKNTNPIPVAEAPPPPLPIPVITVPNDEPEEPIRGKTADANQLPSAQPITPPVSTASSSSPSGDEASLPSAPPIMGCDARGLRSPEEEDDDALSETDGGASRPSATSMSSVDRIESPQPFFMAAKKQQVVPDTNNNKNRKVISQENKVEKAKTTYKSMSREQRDQILEQIRIEGEKVALEWLDTKRGQRLLKHQAKQIQSTTPEISYEKALNQAKTSFIDRHMESWLKKIPSNLFGPH